MRTIQILWYLSSDLQMLLPRPSEKQFAWIDGATVPKLVKMKWNEIFVSLCSFRLFSKAHTCGFIVPRIPQSKESRKGKLGNGNKKGRSLSYHLLFLLIISFVDPVTQGRVTANPNLRVASKFSSVRYRNPKQSLIGSSDQDGSE